MLWIRVKTSFAEQRFQCAPFLNPCTPKQKKHKKGGGEVKKGKNYKVPAGQILIAWGGIKQGSKTPPKESRVNCTSYSQIQSNQTGVTGLLGLQLQPSPLPRGQPFLTQCGVCSTPPAPKHTAQQSGFPVRTTEECQVWTCLNPL